MSRLFTFGCSFTQYAWPTWADILSDNFDEFQNWGKSGAGNQYIGYAISECDIKNNLGENDTVIVMWTSVSREDRYINHQWVTPGNVYTNNDYNSNFVKNYVDMRGFYIRDLSMINLVKGFLESKGVNYYFISMIDIFSNEFDDIGEVDYGDIQWHYQALEKTIRPSVHNVLFGYDWDSRPSDILARDSGYMMPSTVYPRKPNRVRQDRHPSPLEHLEYIEQVVPEIRVSEVTRNNIIEINNLLHNDKFDIDKVWDKNAHIPARL